MMDIEGLHVKYQELNQADVVKEGDTISFSDVKTEIERLYKWENDYYNAVDYRNQLPEETRASIANEFNTVINNFTEMVRLRRDEVANLASRKDEFTANIKRLYKTVYDLFVQDYRGWQVESQGSGLTERLEEIARKAGEDLSQRAKQAQEDLSQRVKKDEEKLEEKGEQETTKIIGAKSTQEWAEEYLKYIRADKVISGQILDTKNNYKRFLRQYSGWKRFLRAECPTFKYWIKYLYIGKFKGAAFYSGDSYVNSSNRWRFWRSAAYSLLLIGGAIYVVYVLQVGVPEKDQILNFFMHKLVFLPLVTVVAIGLIFASKNFRINSNLLEDYRHRYAVAKTIQNLLRLNENAPLRMELITIGSQILFEHRPSGYMDKDSESAILEKILSTQSINLDLGKKN